MFGQIEGRRSRSVWNGNESCLASEKEEEESVYIALNPHAASHWYTLQKQDKQNIKEKFYTTKD